MGQRSTRSEVEWVSLENGNKRERYNVIFSGDDDEKKCF